MPTPKDAPYKVRQRELKKRCKQATVLWVSCRINMYGEKVPVMGTYRREK